MTTLDEFLHIGETITLGSHVFEAEEIKAFAAKYDPQPFHMDEEAAKGSVFGRLCASGWHTVSMWMRYNLLHRQGTGAPAWDGPGPRPQFGPSPGFQNLRWLKPVYAGDTITFMRRTMGYRPTASRPGWLVVNGICEAYNQDGVKVMELESAAMLKTG